MSRLSFDDFWNLVESKGRQNQRMTYHPCCDTWSTKDAKKVRRSHKLSANWKTLFSSCRLSLEEKKKELHAKLIEDGLNIPIILNKPCWTQGRPSMKTEARKIVAEEVRVFQPVLQRFAFFPSTQTKLEPMNMEGNRYSQDANPTTKEAACQTDTQFDPEIFCGKLAERSALPHADSKN